MALIRVINPNSNPAVTEGIADAVAPFALPGIEIECETLAEGPFGIESQRDVESVVLPLAARMKAAPADAFVIACYSDPGLALCRAEIAEPVFGIMESALALALTRGDRFGVIAIAEASIPRHLKAIRAMGLSARLAGERALGVTVAESGGEAVFARLESAGRALVGDGADTVILGCAGMARHRARLEDALGRPVIDPCQAAAAGAVATLLTRGRA